MTTRIPEQPGRRSWPPSGDGAASRPLLPAQTMAAAVATDPQFRLPELPKLVDGLVVLPLDDGLLFEGTGERQVLRGRDAASLVPRILPLLDGSRGLDALSASLPTVPAGHVRAAISLLYTCGLLEDARGATGVSPADAQRPASQFLARQLDTTRVNRNTAEVLDRLGSVRVSIVGDEAVTKTAAAALAGAGLRRVTVRGPEAGPPEGDVDLVVSLALAGAEAGDRLDHLDDWCARHQVPWLHSALVGGTVQVGPYFDRRYTACFRCFQSVRAAPLPHGNPTQRELRTWAALVSTEIVFLLGRIGHIVSTPGWSELDLQNWSQRTLSLPRVPGCHNCLPLDTGSPPGVAVAHQYEQAVAFPPRTLLNPKDHMHHYRPANLALQREGKHYPSAPKEPLRAAAESPAPGGAVLRWLAPSGPPGPVTRDKIGGLVLRVAGLRPDGATTPGKVQRWAPTGGNLGSVHAYVLALDVEDMRPGWFFYDRDAHCLSVVRDCAREAHASVVTSVVGARLPPGPSALLVLTGALSRVAKKYRDFGYRIVCLDAGVAVTQAIATAGGLGIRVQAADRWNDEELIRELDLEPYAEPVTAVLGLYGERHHET